MARRALLIANGTFADPKIGALGSPLRDTERLAKLLERPEVGGYAVTRCADFDSPAARLAVQRFFAAAGSGDLNLVLISTHGIKDRAGKLHFATADSRIDALRATSLESRFVLECMDESPATQQLLFLDACYSGAFRKGVVGKDAAQAIVREDFGDAGASGKAIITAATAIQVAGEADVAGTRQSVFTRHLIDGIESGAADRDLTGRITLAELFAHIRENLRRDAPGQDPQPFYDGLDGSVVVALNPVPVALPADIAARIAARDTDERARAVDPLLALVRAGGPMRTLAIAALRAFADDDSTLIQAAAERALRRAGVSEPPRPAPPRPAAQGLFDGQAWTAPPALTDAHVFAKRPAQPVWTPPPGAALVAGASPSWFRQNVMYVGIAAGTAILTVWTQLSKDDAPAASGAPAATIAAPGDAKVPADDPAAAAALHDEAVKLRDAPEAARDDARAVALFRRAAEAGRAGAATDLGYMYDLGRGVARDREEAKRWYLIGAERGSATAMYNLGTLFFNGDGAAKNAAAAAPWFRRAAGKGDVDAQRRLGLMYLYGDGVAADPAMAASFFRKAADQGDAVAMNALGGLYQDGKGVPLDRKEAARLYQAAAGKGLIEGQYNWAVSLDNGTLVTRDVEGALRWYKAVLDNEAEDAGLKKTATERIEALSITSIKG